MSDEPVIPAAPDRDEALRQRFRRAAAARPAVWLVAPRLCAAVNRFFGRPVPLLPRIYCRSRDRHWVDLVLAVAQARSPVARQALAWAAAHGVSIEIGRHPHAGGSYDNMGHVLVDRHRCTDILSAINIIVHEIRHAWQDYYGLLPASTRRYGIGDRLVINALVEADAQAMGELAQLESGRRHPVRNPRMRLESAFRRWFQGKAPLYHQSMLDWHADAERREMRRPLSHRLPAAQALQWPSILDRLGRGFDGRHYMTGGLQDFIRREVLPHGRALGAFGASPAANDARAVDKRERFARVRR